MGQNQVIVFFVVYAIFAFIILVAVSKNIFANYYSQTLVPPGGFLPPAVNQTATSQNVQAAVNSAAAAAAAAAAPGAAASPNLSNPVSASIAQLSQYTQTSNAANNIPSPSAGADIGSILSYLLARGSRLDGSAWSEEALRVLKNRTPWTCGGTGSQTICTYPAGIDTQQTWIIFYDDASGKWNLRAQQ